jgi:hypothetical protein
MDARMRNLKTNRMTEQLIGHEGAVRLGVFLAIFAAMAAWE